MAYDDAARVDVATARTTDANSEQTDLRAAAKVWGEAVETVLETNGQAAGGKVVVAFHDKLIDMLRYLDHELDIDNS